MNPNAPMIILSPLVDRDGTPIEGLGGEPLAADPQGIVYTLRDDGLPQIMGELAPSNDGRLILVPLNGLGTNADEKSQRMQYAWRRRAHARHRRHHWEKVIRHLTQQIEQGQKSGNVTPHHIAKLEKERTDATAHLEKAKAREVTAQTALDAASTLQLADDQADMAGDDDMAGLAGRRRFSRKMIKHGALMAFTGGAAAPFLMAGQTRQGKKSFGRFLNDDGTDPMMAGNESPVSTQVSGLGASWWSRNREKVLGFGAGAASAALVASAASPGTGLNTLVSKGWDAAKGFFVPGQTAPPAAGMPAAAPMMMPMSRSAGPSMPMVQAGIGGMDPKTLLLLGGLGLGVLVLFRPKK